MNLYWKIRLWLAMLMLRWFCWRLRRQMDREDKARTDKILNDL